MATDLFLGQTATADGSTGGIIQDPSLAVDGDASYGDAFIWADPTEEDTHLDVDAGSAFTLRYMTFTQAETVQYATRVHVLGSNDGTTYTPVVDLTPPSPGTYTLSFANSVAYRYYRLLLGTLAVGNNGYWRVNSVTAYVVVPPADLFLSRPATWGGGGSPVQDPSLAVDGSDSYGDAWITQDMVEGGTYIQIDCGRDVSIRSVRIVQAETVQYATRMFLEASSDGLTFSVAASFYPLSPGEYMTNIASPGLYRYYRLRLGTMAVGNNGYWRVNTLSAYSVPVVYPDTTQISRLDSFDWYTVPEIVYPPGSIANSPAIAVGGPRGGRALHLTENNQRVRIEQIGGEYQTLAGFRLRCDALPADQNPLAAFSNSFDWTWDNQFAYLALTSAGGIQAWTRDTTGDILMCETAPGVIVASGTWDHYIEWYFAFDSEPGGATVIYVDGQALAGASGINTIPTGWTRVPLAYLTIGGFQDSSPAAVDNWLADLYLSDGQPTAVYGDVQVLVTHPASNGSLQEWDGGTYADIDDAYFDGASGHSYVYTTGPDQLTTYHFQPLTPAVRGKPIGAAQLTTQWQGIAGPHLSPHAGGIADAPPTWEEPFNFWGRASINGWAGVSHLWWDAPTAGGTLRAALSGPVVDALEWGMRGRCGEVGQEVELANLVLEVMVFQPLFSVATRVPIPQIIG